MERFGLRDDQSERFKDFLPGREGHNAADNRLFVNAVLYRNRADAGDTRSYQLKMGISRNTASRAHSQGNKGEAITQGSTRPVVRFPPLGHAEHRADQGNAPTALPRGAQGVRCGVAQQGIDAMGFPNQYRKFEPDPPAAAASDTVVERELLESENDRLKRENAALKSALRTAGKVLGPYLLDGDTSRRR
jgi:hypothetical protein